MTARNFGLFYNRWRLHLSIKTPLRTTWMKLWQKEPPMEYLQGAPYTSTLTGKEEEEMHLLVQSDWLLKVKFSMTYQWRKENKGKNKKKKKQNYVSERITLKSYEPLKIISTRYCAIKNPKWESKFFNYQEKKHNAHIIVLSNAHILIRP